MKREQKSWIGFWVLLFGGVFWIGLGYIAGRQGRLDYQIMAQLVGFYSLMAGLYALTVMRLFKIESSLEEIKKKLEEKTVQG